MPKQFILKLTNKELELLGAALDMMANEMLAESEDSPKANWYYTPSKRKTFSSLTTKISETKNGG
jgi:hypothetical protein